MALIECPECSKTVSDKAVSCPQCGFPIAADLSSPKLSETVECLTCKETFPFDDQVCPHCGLFNSQKYILLESLGYEEESKSTPVVVRNDDDFIRCPKCGAKNAYHVGQQGFGVGKLVAGLALVGPLTGLLAGKINSKKVIITCLKCSHEWRP